MEAEERAAPGALEALSLLGHDACWERRLRLAIQNALGERVSHFFLSNQLREWNFRSVSVAGTRCTGFISSWHPGTSALYVFMHVTEVGRWRQGHEFKVSPTDEGISSFIPAFVANIGR